MIKALHSKFLSIELYLHPKVIAVFFLGFSSGLPLALVYSTLSVWLTEVEVSKTAIGLFALTGAAYTFKFLWSPLVDHMPIPFFTKYLGKRRGWMVASQLLLMLSLVCLGMTHPDKALHLTALWAVIVAFMSATQDIVIDAYRVEILKREQQGAGAATIVFGYRIGMVVSGAGALFIATYLSWFTTYVIMASLILVGIVTVLITGEPFKENKEKDKNELLGLSRAKSWLKGAVLDPFIDFMRNDKWWLIIAFIILYKFGDAFAGVMTNPFLVETGFSKAEIASVVKLFGLAATIIGAFIGGVLVSKYGMIKSLLICGILQMLSNFMFVAQAHIGHNIEFLAATIAIENLSGGMGTTAFVAYISSLCNKEYTATQYALMSSLAAFARTFFSASSGWFVDHIGWSNFFLLSTAIAIPGILLLFFLKREGQGTILKEAKETS